MQPTWFSGILSGFQSVLDLTALDGTDGFNIDAEGTSGNNGVSVASAGDVNGDGIDDLLIGQRSAGDNPPGAGSSYVVFGNSSGFGAEFDISSLDGQDGFRVNGEAANDASGASVSSAGDINGDGFDDLLIGVSLLPIRTAIFPVPATLSLAQAGGFPAESRSPISMARMVFRLTAKQQETVLAFQSPPSET